MDTPNVQYRPKPVQVANRTATTQSSGSGSEPQQTTNSTRKTPFLKRRRSVLITAAIALLVLGGIGWYFWKSTAGSLVGNGYQAVFLTNGQVYFGKLRIVNDSYMKISNVYYIQDKTTTTQQTDTSTNSVEMTKLINAVHGPKDEMVINKDQVLFFENLRDDGQAAKLISGDKN